MALTLGNLLKSAKKKRPGVHAKSKTSNSKQAKNYKKKYRGQGKKIISKIVMERMQLSVFWMFFIFHSGEGLELYSDTP